VSEMFVDGFLALLRAGILKREVDGVLLHAAFFLGTKEFYRALREMPDDALARIRMSAVSFTNELGSDNSKRAARANARFVNSTMMATLSGEAISDTLEDGRVVSGVGGQYNFVAQSFELAGARSILTLRSTRGGRRLSSNLRSSYPHVTIPRHLRDTFVSEYGVADLKGKTDAECIAAMLAIADSRFQPELLKAAKNAGKIDRSYEIPSGFRENTPERIERALKPFAGEGYLPAFPLGTDFDAAELALVPILEHLENAAPVELARLALRGLWRGAPSSPEATILARMGLAAPKTIQEHVFRALIRGAFEH
jgi:acyl-CoA hydrolase